MTVATELLARLEDHGITAHLAPDGSVELHGPHVPDRALELLTKHERPVRGVLAHQAHLAGGEPSHWCHVCGRDVQQFTPDGAAWCDLCLVAHAARTVERVMNSEQVKTEEAPNPQLFT